jgi:hypothetical protein
MSTAGLWGGGLLATLLLFSAVYLALLLRGLANERVIGNAISAMTAACRAQYVPPQRRLLRSVTETLADQERAAAQIEAAVHESMLPGQDVRDPAEIIRALIGLPEPQSLVTDFLTEYAGDAGSAGTFGAFAGQVVRSETRRVYADLDDGCSPALDRLLALALEGRIGAVAIAGLKVRAGAPGPHAPQLTDVGSIAVADIVRALEHATRRQLRLATLLHGQAEAILRLRSARTEENAGGIIWSWLRPRRRGEPGGQDTGRERTTIWFGLHRMLAAPRLKLRGVTFGADDLKALEVVFDAIGEVVANAVDCTARGEPMRALYLLSGVSVPVSASLPGRIYNQDSLAQVRPLAVLGVWHRLAVCRWAATATREPVLQASSRERAAPPGAWEGNA